MTTTPSPSHTYIKPPIPTRGTHVLIVPVIGCTCAGKTTFMDYVRDACFLRKDGDKIGTVEVGRAMRAKYPPSHFQGQASPAHTRKEAWELCVAGVNEHIKAGRTLIFIDGQPRDFEQLYDMRTLWAEGSTSLWFTHLYAPLKVRKHRALRRAFPSQESRSEPRALEEFELLWARLTDDMRLYYEITTVLNYYNIPSTIFDTSHPSFSNEAVLRMFYEYCFGILPPA